MAEHELHFIKMHGAGNDFVVFDGRYGVQFPLAEFAQAACDRHFGIGADGIIALRNSEVADFGMAYFNADGSPSVCGNGMRCLARFIVDTNLLRSAERTFVLETDAGLVNIEVFGRGERARVDMGQPIFLPTSIPLAPDGAEFRNEIIAVGRKFVGYAVSMGNPHFVIFLHENSHLGPLAHIDLGEIGPALEHHPLFPKRANVEFVQVVDRHLLQMRVWERGVGETLACGTGNCAASAAAARAGFAERHIVLASRGGNFEVFIDDSDRIFLTGPAEEVYRATVDPQRLIASYRAQRGDTGTIVA